MTNIRHNDFFAIFLRDDFKITIVVGEIYTVATFKFDGCTYEGLAVAFYDATFVFFLFLLFFYVFHVVFFF